MQIEAVTRFNQHDPGEKFEAEEADAKKWIKNKLAKPAKANKESGADAADTPAENKGKGTEAPPADKAVKEPEKKK